MGRAVLAAEQALCDVQLSIGEICCRPAAYFIGARRYCRGCGEPVVAWLERQSWWRVTKTHEEVAAKAILNEQKPPELKLWIFDSGEAAAQGGDRRVGVRAATRSEALDIIAARFGRKALWQQDNHGQRVAVPVYELVLLE